MVTKAGKFKRMQKAHIKRTGMPKYHVGYKPRVKPTKQYRKFWKS